MATKADLLAEQEKVAAAGEKVKQLSAEVKRLRQLQDTTSVALQSAHAAIERLETRLAQRSTDADKIVRAEKERSTEITAALRSQIARMTTDRAELDAQLKKAVQNTNLQSRLAAAEAKLAQIRKLL